MDTGDRFALNLIDAARRGDLPTLKDLLRRQDVIDPPLLAEALCGAAFEGHLDAIDLLVRHGANVNGRPAHSLAPLHCAIENEQPAAVERLLDLGADVNGSISGIFTPLHHAIDIEADSAKNQSDDVGFPVAPATVLTELLVARGADLQARDDRGSVSPWNGDIWSRLKSSRRRPHLIHRAPERSSRARTNTWRGISTSQNATVRARSTPAINSLLSGLTAGVPIPKPPTAWPSPGSGGSRMSRSTRPR